MRSVCGLGGVRWIPVQVAVGLLGSQEHRPRVQAGPDLSFSVPHIEAKYSTIFIRTLQLGLTNTFSGDFAGFNVIW